MKQVLLFCSALFLVMTIGGTASAWSTAYSDFKSFKQDSTPNFTSVAHLPTVIKGLVAAKHTAGAKKFEWDWNGDKLKFKFHKNGSALKLKGHGLKPLWATYIKPIKHFEKPPNQCPTQPIPEPSAALVYGAGLLLIAQRSRRRS